MGRILLVRHGQASFGAADYDVLSPTGEEQAAELGRALADLAPDVVLHGTMQRQRRTAEIAAEAAGWSATPEVDERWNEMDHLGVVAAYPEPLAAEPDRRAFQAHFEGAVRRWTSGDHDTDYAETFLEFRARVAEALRDLTDVRTAVVVSSGGPISSIATDLLQAELPTYARLTAVVVNASVTKVVTGRSGTSLVSFNEHSHLSPESITYR